MAAFVWVLHDASGKDVGTSPDFDTRADAEAWMGDEWKRLLDEGADSVSLIDSESDETCYRMGLRAQ